MRVFNVIFVVGVFLLFFLLVSGTLQKATAATITVTSNANSGAGTLRQALSDAVDGDTILFSLSAGNEVATVSSTLTYPTTKSLTINGDNTAGSGTDITLKVTTPGSSTYPVWTFISVNSRTITLKNMTMRGGDAPSGSGGAISMSFSTSNLIIENSTIKDGRGRFGAGIWANGFTSLTITNSTFSNNIAVDHGGAARIDSFTGTASISGSTFDSNSTTNTGGNYYGGALYFQNNSAQGTVTIDKTTFSNNSVYRSGAGVYSQNTNNLIITNSTFNNNTNSGGSGGGLYVTGGATVITNSTFTGNSNVNYGGGAFLSGAVTLTNLTVAGNTSTSSTADGIYLSSGTVAIKNSLFANSGSNHYDFTRGSGTVTDNGYNIVETSSGQTFNATGDITGDQASLNISSTLADNSTLYGTKTLALSSGSVAIDAGNDSSANNGVVIPATDQRGFSRSGGTDIGAYEYDTTTTPTPTPTNTPTPTPTPTVTLTPTPTPTPTPIPTESNNSSGTSTSQSSIQSSNACTVSAPVGSPNLYQINLSGNESELFFTPVDNADSYYISYGTNSNAEGYGVTFKYSDKSGAIAYKIGSLETGKTYYFKIRGGNGCATGDWSNINRVSLNNAYTEFISDLTKDEVEIKEVVFENRKSNVCEYLVEEGDNLWSIAESSLGNGKYFQEISDLNNLSQGFLGIGQKLKLPCDVDGLEKAKEEIESSGVSLEINVKDTKNRPVKGATVTLHSKVQVSKTNDEGVVTFKNVAAGGHRVIIAYGTFTGERKIDVKGDSKIQDLSLKVEMNSGFSYPAVIAVIGSLISIIVILLAIILRKRNIYLKK